MKGFHFKPSSLNSPISCPYMRFHAHVIDVRGDIVPSTIFVDTSSSPDRDMLKETMHKRSFTIVVPGLITCEFSDRNNPEKFVRGPDTVYVVNYTKHVWVKNMRMMIDIGIISADVANHIEATEEDQFPMKTKVKVKKLKSKERK